MSNLSISFLSALAAEAAASKNKAAAAASIKAYGLWPVAAAAAEVNPTEAAAAMAESAAAVAGIIAAAVAANSSEYFVDGVVFSVSRDSKGDAKPTSKQAIYMRLSDLGGMFKSVAALPEAYASGIFRANTEAAALLGERAFKVALADAKQKAALSALSPIRRLWSEVELLEAAEAEAVAGIEKAAAALQLAEAAAAAARSRKLEKESTAMEGEAAAAAAIGSNGRYLPAALREAKEAAAAASVHADQWKAKAEAAEAAAAAAVTSAAAVASKKRKAAAAA